MHTDTWHGSRSYVHIRIVVEGKTGCGPMPRPRQPAWKEMTRNRIWFPRRTFYTWITISCPDASIVARLAPDGRHSNRHSRKFFSSLPSIPSIVSFLAHLLPTRFHHTRYTHLSSSHNFSEVEVLRGGRSPSPTLDIFASENSFLLLEPSQFLHQPRNIRVHPCL